MSWILISILGYFLNSIATLSDKLILRRAVPHPAVYTFYATGLGALALVLFPFAPGIPRLPLLVVALSAGALFTIALYQSYVLFIENDISVVSPTIGSLVPAWTFITSTFILGEILSAQQLLAFVIILIGSVLIAHEHRRLTPRDIHIIGKSAIAALLFALSFVLSKYVYMNGSFLNGFLWRTVGGSLAALPLLFMPEMRRYLIADLARAKPAAGTIFFIGKICGGLAFVALNYAFAIGSIALVQALVGIQHVFLLILILVLARPYPKLLTEHLHGIALKRKVISIIIMSAGIGLLFL